jgi:polyphosphate kinase
MQRMWVQKFFQREVQPLLVPVGLDPSHPFPQVANKSLNFIVRLGGKDAFGRENTIAIVKVPRVLSRVVKMPSALSQGCQAFVLLTSMIRAHLQQLFPGREVAAFSQFRVTRDSDLNVDENEVTNLRQALRSGLTSRHFGQAIRLEVVSTCPPELCDFLLKQFSLPAAALYKVNGPVNLVRLNELIDQVIEPQTPSSTAHPAEPKPLQMRFPHFEPAWPHTTLPLNVSMFESLRTRDVLLHHPFESFEPVVQLLREAVQDPHVLSIKQTIYRTGSESALMDLLIEGARRGKEIMVVVELKARFDEEANINWAERLEAVGVQVVYGVVGLKTHAKLLVITRREQKNARTRPQLRRYAHLSTGNYNPKTARLYTDVGLLTAHPQITADADAVFQQIASLGRTKPLRYLLQAPFSLHKQMMLHIQKVGAAARAGLAARIVVKVNALTDVALIQALVIAAQDGASIDLIIRGACMLPPGLPGVTERIRVRSVVGRFLEHTRICYFCWGTQAGADSGTDSGAEANASSTKTTEALFLSSADWMSRNMVGRIEVAWPVLDTNLRQRVIDECLVPYLHDQQDAWQLQPDGNYERITATGPGAQQALIQRYSFGLEQPDTPQ